MTSLKILVVDDEPAVCRVLEATFLRRQHHVRVAEDPEEALALVQSWEPEIVFLDLWLPRMTGVELCRRIRESKPLTLIYALTGYLTLFDAWDCRQAGFDDFFQKPAELDDLLRAVESALEKRNRWAG